jgi:neutral amino acid transport system permease protein
VNRRRLTFVFVAGLTVVNCTLVTAYGLHAVGQATLYGLVAGSYFALAAVGLTLVYGVLRLVNFAHGDLLTFGAYVAFLLNVTLGVAFVPAVLGAVAATGALGVAFEAWLWRPMRRRGANLFQLLLISIGVAFLIRHGVQFFAGGQLRSFDVDIVSSVELLGFRLGRMQLTVMLVGITALIAMGLVLRYSTIGKQMRALADDLELAETAGIDTERVVIVTWLCAAGLGGLAGVLYAAAIGVLNPNLGFSLLLSLFASVVLGGIGSAYGALAGGLLIGVSQEWATLVFNPRWKPTVGFVILVLTLLVLPQGLLGRNRAL